MTETEFKTPKTGQLIPIDVRCRDCFHFTKERANQYADVCSKLGIVKEARPCRAFLPNVDTLSFKDDNTKSLAEILAKIPTSKLALIAGLINQERATRRQGFKNGQVVYIKIYGDDYLSNYAKAWVMLAFRGRVVVQGVNGFRGSFMAQSILTEEKFALKSKILKSRKRINDPKKKQYSIPRIKQNIKVLKDYEPPTIDNVIKSKSLAKDNSLRNKPIDIIIRGGRNEKTTH